MIYQSLHQLMLCCINLSAWLRYLFPLNWIKHRICYRITSRRRCESQIHIIITAPTSTGFKFTIIFHHKCYSFFFILPYLRTLYILHFILYVIVVSSVVSILQNCKIHFILHYNQCSNNSLFITRVTYRKIESIRRTHV